MRIEAKCHTCKRADEVEVAWEWSDVLEDLVPDLGNCQGCGGIMDLPELGSPGAGRRGPGATP